MKAVEACLKALPQRLAAAAKENNDDVQFLFSDRPFSRVEC
jgi:hypothetical protein